jgi:hypothetical protein
VNLKFTDTADTTIASLFQNTFLAPWILSRFNRAVISDIDWGAVLYCTGGTAGEGGAGGGTGDRPAVERRKQEGRAAGQQPAASRQAASDDLPISKYRISDS